MRRRRFLSVALLAALLLVAGLAAAQSDFDLDWHTTEAGGRSSGGSYTLHGVLGQPDAGEGAGAAFRLEGGFLAAAPAQGRTSVHLPVIFRQRANLPVR